MGERGPAVLERLQGSAPVRERDRAGMVQEREASAAHGDDASQPLARRPEPVGIGAVRLRSYAPTCRWSAFELRSVGGLAPSCADHRRPLHRRRAVRRSGGMGLPARGPGRPPPDPGRPARHPPFPARPGRRRGLGPDPRRRSRRPVGRSFAAVAVCPGGRPRHPGPRRAAGRPGPSRPGRRPGARCRPSAVGPGSRGHQGGADRPGGLLRPAGRARRGAGSGHLRRCRPVVLRLRHREPLVGGPGRGAGRSAGSPCSTPPTWPPWSARRPAWPRSAGCASAGRTNVRRPRDWSVAAGRERLPLDDLVFRDRWPAGDAGPDPPVSRLLAPRAGGGRGGARPRRSHPHRARVARRPRPGRRQDSGARRPGGRRHPRHRRGRPSRHGPRGVRLPDRGHPACGRSRRGRNLRRGGGGARR